MLKNFPITAHVALFLIVFVPSVCAGIFWLDHSILPTQSGTAKSQLVFAPSPYKRSPNPPIVKAKKCTPDVGYIRVETYGDYNSVWNTRDAYNQLKDCKAIVFDCRECDGGSFAGTLSMIELASDWGTECSFEANIPQENNRRIRKEYRLNGGSREVYTYGNGGSGAPEYENREFNYAGNRLMVVLGNEDTEGGAEIFLVSLKENGRAKFIGETTRGNAWERIVLKNKNSGQEYYIDDAYIYSPNGRPMCYGRAGGVTTQPDKGFEIKADKDIVYGSDNDNQLKFAVEYLTNELAKKPKKK